MGVNDLRLELVIASRLTASFREVKDSCIDLGVDNSVNDFGIVVGIRSLCTDFLDHISQAVDFSFDLSLDLLDTESFSIDYDELWARFVDADIVFGPVDHHVLEICLRNSLLVFVASFAAVEDFSEILIDSSGESQSESLFAL